MKRQGDRIYDFFVKRNKSGKDQTDSQNSALASAVLAVPILGLVRRVNVRQNPTHHYHIRASTGAVTYSVQSFQVKGELRFF